MSDGSGDRGDTDNNVETNGTSSPACSNVPEVPITPMPSSSQETKAVDNPEENHAVKTSEEIAPEAAAIPVTTESVEATAEDSDGVHDLD